MKRRFARSSSGNYMAFDEIADDVLRRILQILESANIPYMLTGSFASSIHGSPRATQDIDLVIAPNPISLDDLLKHFPEDKYYVRRTQGAGLDTACVDRWVADLGLQLDWSRAQMKERQP